MSLLGTPPAWRQRGKAGPAAVPVLFCSVLRSDSVWSGSSEDGNRRQEAPALPQLLARKPEVWARRRCGGTDGPLHNVQGWTRQGTGTPWRVWNRGSGPELHLAEGRPDRAHEAARGERGGGSEEEEDEEEEGPTPGAVGPDCGWTLEAGHWELRPSGAAFQVSELAAFTRVASRLAPTQASVGIAQAARAAERMGPSSDSELAAL